MADVENVIKAWDCCNPFNRKCKECPYEKDCYHDGISRHMVADAVAMLKSQQAEIDRMKNLLSDDQPCPPPPKGGEEQRWIPVSERMPEEDEDVLVLNGTECFVMRLVNSDKTDVWHWDGSYCMEWQNFNGTEHADICDVTHWMPLPEPPMMD